MLAMGNFNRGSRPSGGRGFARRGFNGRDVRSPAQMHPAVCDNCNKNCEVPFRPTSGNPIFCSDCFENKKGPGAGRFEGRDESRFQRSDERQMFDAVCDDCGNDCKVPFRPSGEKPIFCSNCFGDKKGNGERNREQAPAQPQQNAQFELLNTKLDKILQMLTPNSFMQAAEEEQAEITEEVAKTPKKKSPKKK